MPRNPAIKHPSRKDLDILVAAMNEKHQLRGFNQAVVTSLRRRLTAAATLLAGQAGRYGNPTDGTIKDACETAAKIFDQLVEML